MLWEIVTSLPRFHELVSNWDILVACDVETFKTDPKEGRLLGISLSSNGPITLYIPFWVRTVADDGREVWTKHVEPSLESGLGEWLLSKQLVGHNFTYDKKWVDATFSVNSMWKVDTRIMWHLSAAPSGPRPYGLKDAQVELLGWSERGDSGLAEHVEGKGGRLDKGDHYLADLDILAEYACKDTFSTFAVCKKLTPFFEHHDYWWMLEMMMHYNTLLEENTCLGVKVDEDGLKHTHLRLLSSRDAAMNRCKVELGDAIEELEQDWLDRRLAEYKRDYNRARLLAHPEDWQRFNWNSDKDKRELFYDKLGNEVVYKTDGGKPSVNADAVNQMAGDWTKSYLKYEWANTLTTSFTGPYLKQVKNGRLHPGFNICGTVSYRLSGFKPYFLNAPFSERIIFKNMVLDPGRTGIHLDWNAVEPCITTHYSEDPTLLKVFRDGLGDIYLDLALYLFKGDRGLQEGYDPNIPVTSAIKKKFVKRRDPGKQVHLAVQYTGKGATVAKNLTKNGFPTSVWQATQYVADYWRKFRKVAETNEKLKELHRRQGFLRNVIGRIIQVPESNWKDLPNRFYQSSGHDCLILLVLEIDRLRKERKVDLRPILLDCHDSTSWDCPTEQVEAGEAIFRDAVAHVNAVLGLSVTLKAEMKRFTTLAGLKGDS